MHYLGQDVLWLVGSLSRVFRLPFDAQLVRQQFPPPYSRTSLLNALQTLDFKIGEMELSEESIATLERIPFPWWLLCGKMRSLLLLKLPLKLLMRQMHHLPPPCC